MRSQGLHLTLLPACAASLPATPRSGRVFSLSGEWRSTTGSQDKGQALCWLDHQPETRWDRVTVPHCWKADPRFPHPGATRHRYDCPTPAGWDCKSLPGAGPGDTLEERVYPRREFRGLIRDVTLQAVPNVSIETLKVAPEPDMASGAKTSSGSIAAEALREESPLLCAYRRQQVLEVSANGLAIPRRLQLIRPTGSPIGGERTLPLQ
ncbi:MAG: hypothetical protein HY821_10305 [Acidobacteria bacterium]|nr:hypothetical protein [Acidobacteriota bacterium]